MSIKYICIIGNKKIFTLIKTNDINECNGRILRVYNFFDDNILDNVFLKITKIIRKYDLEISINNFKETEKCSIKFILDKIDSIMNPKIETTNKKIVDKSFDNIMEKYKDKNLIL